MAIVFSCDGGHRLVVDDSLGGRKVMCPTCRRIVVAPAIAPDTFHIPECTLAEGSAPVSPAKLAELRARFRRKTDLLPPQPPPSPATQSAPAKPPVPADKRPQPAPPKPSPKVNASAPAPPEKPPVKPLPKVNASPPLPAAKPSPKLNGSAPATPTKPQAKPSSKVNASVSVTPIKTPASAPPQKATQKVAPTPKAKPARTVTFEGVTYPTTESHEGFCKGIAVGMARAIRIEFADYGHHRTDIARRYAKRFGESMDASTSILHAPLGCARCGKRMLVPFMRALIEPPPEPEEGDDDPPPPEPPQCPFCGSKFAYLLYEPTHDFDSKASAPDLPWDPNESYLQTKRFKKSTCQQLLRVRIGITLHEAQMILYLVVILTAITGILSVVVLQPRPVNVDRITVLTVATVIVGAVVGRGLGIAGSIMCCFAPLKLKGHVRIISSLALDALSLMFTVAHVLVTGINSHYGQFEPDDDANNVLGFLTNVSGIASWVMFMMFLIRLGIFLRQWGAAEQARSVILRGFVLILSPIVVLTALRIVLPHCDPVVIIVLLFVLCALAFMWFILWIQLMFATVDMFRSFREAIATAVADSTN